MRYYGERKRAKKVVMTLCNGSTIPSNLVGAHLHLHLFFNVYIASCIIL